MAILLVAQDRFDELFLIWGVLRIAGGRVAAMPPTVLGRVTGRGRRFRFPSDPPGR
jgi:hypothetical protein